MKEQYGNHSAGLNVKTNFTQPEDFFLPLRSW